jgi:hypothetical protein
VELFDEIPTLVWTHVLRKSLWKPCYALTDPLQERGNPKRAFLGEEEASSYSSSPCAFLPTNLGQGECPPAEMSDMVMCVRPRA